MQEQSEPRPRQFVPALVALAFLLVAAATGLAAELSWKQAQAQDAAFYATPEAKRIAENVLKCQGDTGGWAKNINYGKANVVVDQGAKDFGTTIDNGGTTGEMTYLAKMHAATGESRYAEAFLRGFDFLIKMQYDNGGFPQVYPLQGGYHDNITYNDDAMIRVLDLMRDVARGEEPYGFVDSTRRKHAAAAVDKGVECILNTQVVVNGQRTVWCAQHDQKTYEPTKARAYELPSLSGMETVPIVRFLMSIEDPSPRVIEAVQSAVAWLDANKIEGIEMIETTTNGERDRVIVKKPGAEPQWARFYEIQTNRPMFCGRDGVVKYSMDQIEQERRRGYRWYTNRANSLLEKEYPAWQKRFAPEANMLAGR